MHAHPCKHLRVGPSVQTPPSRTLRACTYVQALPCGPFLQTSAYTRPGARTSVRTPPCRCFRAGSAVQTRPGMLLPCRRLRAGTPVQVSPCRHLRADISVQAPPCRPLRGGSSVQIPPCTHFRASSSVQAPPCRHLRFMTSIEGQNQNFVTFFRPRQNAQGPYESDLHISACACHLSKIPRNHALAMII